MQQWRMKVIQTVAESRIMEVKEGELTICCMPLDPAMPDLHFSQLHKTEIACFCIS